MPKLIGINLFHKEYSPKLVVETEKKIRADLDLNDKFELLIKYDDSGKVFSVLAGNTSTSMGQILKTFVKNNMIDIYTPCIVFNTPVDLSITDDKVGRLYEILIGEPPFSAKGNWKNSGQYYFVEENLSDILLTARTNLDCNVFYIQDGDTFDIKVTNPRGPKLPKYYYIPSSKAYSGMNDGEFNAAVRETDSTSDITGNYVRCRFAGVNAAETPKEGAAGEDARKRNYDWAKSSLPKEQVADYTGKVDAAFEVGTEAKNLWKSLSITDSYYVIDNVAGDASTSKGHDMYKRLIGTMFVRADGHWINLNKTLLRNNSIIHPEYPLAVPLTFDENGRILASDITINTISYFTNYIQSQQQIFASKINPLINTEDSGMAKFIKDHDLITKVGEDGETYLMYKEIYHEAKDGETFGTLFTNYQVSVSDIASYNGINAKDINESTTLISGSMYRIPISNVEVMDNSTSIFTGQYAVGDKVPNICTVPADCEHENYYRPKIDDRDELDDIVRISQTNFDGIIRPGDNTIAYSPYGSHYLRIGDCTLPISPLSIKFDVVSSNQRVASLRTRSSLQTNVGHSSQEITVELFFSRLEDINGKPCSNPLDAANPYFRNGLRPLVAQFYKAPFLPIENELINKVHKVYSVALKDLNISTVPGFPNCIQATLTLLPFDHTVYTYSHDWFEGMFCWPMFRWYYQQMMHPGQKEKDRTFLKKVEKFDNNIVFKLPDEEQLKARMKAIFDLQKKTAASIKEEDYIEQNTGLEDDSTKIIMGQSQYNRFAKAIDQIDKDKYPELFVQSGGTRVFDMSKIETLTPAPNDVKKDMDASSKERIVKYVKMLANLYYRTYANDKAMVFVINGASQAAYDRMFEYINKIYKERLVYDPSTDQNMEDYIEFKNNLNMCNTLYTIYNGVINKATGNLTPEEQARANTPDAAIIDPHGAGNAAGISGLVIGALIAGLIVSGLLTGGATWLLVGGTALGAILGGAGGALGGWMYGHSIDKESIFNELYSGSMYKKTLYWDTFKEHFTYHGSTIDQEIKDGQIIELFISNGKNTNFKNPNAKGGYIVLKITSNDIASALDPNHIKSGNSYMLEPNSHVASLDIDIEQGREVLAQQYKDELMKLEYLAHMSEEDIETIDYPIDDMYIQSMNAGIYNRFAPLQLQGTEFPTLQFLGGSDIVINMQIRTKSRDALAKFEHLIFEAQRLSREYRIAITSGVLSFDHPFFSLFGAHSILIEKFSVVTSPQDKESFIISLDIVSFDKTQRRREELNKFGYGDEFKNMTAFEKFNRLKRNNSEIDYGCIDFKLRQAELYPDLELPTYKEVNDFLSRQEIKNMYGERFTSLPNPTWAKYVDPDFYIRTDETLRDHIESTLNQGDIGLVMKDRFGNAIIDKAPTVDQQLGLEAKSGPEVVLNNESIETWNNNVGRYAAISGLGKINKGVSAEAAWSLGHGGVPTVNSDNGNSQVELTKVWPSIVKIARNKVLSYNDGGASFDELINNPLTPVDVRESLLAEKAKTNGVKKVLGAKVFKVNTSWIAERAKTYKMSPENVPQSINIYVLDPNGLLDLTTKKVGYAAWQFGGFMGQFSTIEDYPANLISEFLSIYIQGYLIKEWDRIDFSSVDSNGLMIILTGDKLKDIFAIGVSGGTVDNWRFDIPEIRKIDNVAAEYVSTFKHYSTNIQGFKYDLVSSYIRRYFSDTLGISLYDLASSSNISKMEADVLLATFSDYENIVKSIDNNTSVTSVDTSYTIKTNDLISRISSNDKNPISSMSLYNDNSGMKLYKYNNDSIPYYITAQYKDKETQTRLNMEWPININFLISNKDKEGLDNSRLQSIMKYCKTFIMYNRATNAYTLNSKTGDSGKVINTKAEYNYIVSLKDGIESAVKKIDAQCGSIIDGLTILDNGPVNDACKKEFASLIKDISSGINIVSTNEENILSKDEINNLSDEVNAVENIEYKEDLETARLYRSSYDDILKYDQRGRLLRAFPSFHMFIIDEGKDGLFYSLWDNFYSYNSIVSIDVVKDRRIIADTAIITMTNIYHNLSTYDSEVSYGEWKYTFMDIFSGNHWADGWKTLLNLPDMDIVRARQEEINSLLLKPGARIHLRMGYGSNAYNLPIMINGTITEMNAEEVVTVIVQSDGVELTNKINVGPDATTDPGPMEIPLEPRRIIGDMMTSKGGWWENTFNMFSNNWLFRNNPLGIVHFGNRDKAPEIADSLQQWSKKVFSRRGNRLFTWFVDSDLEQEGTLGDEGENYGAPLLNVYAGGKARSMSQYIYTDFNPSSKEFSHETTGFRWETGMLLPDLKANAAPTARIYLFDMTPSDVFQVLASVCPDYICAVHPFETRSTLFFGKPYWGMADRYYYAYKYDKDMDNVIRIPVGYSRKAYSQSRIYNSQTDIIGNSISASSEIMKTNMIAVYNEKNGAKQTSVVQVDSDIYDEAQTTGIVHVPIKADSGPVNIFDTYNFFNQGKWAEVTAVTELQKSVMEMYQGELIVLGDPSAKPHDTMYIQDSHTQMKGIAGVKRVVHQLSVETGFITSITPDCITIADDMRMVSSKMWFANTASLFVSYVIGKTIANIVWRKTLHGPVASIVRDLGGHALEFIFRGQMHANMTDDGAKILVQHYNGRFTDKFFLHNLSDTGMIDSNKAFMQIYDNIEDQVKVSEVVLKNKTKTIEELIEAGAFDGLNLKTIDKTKLKTEVTKYVVDEESLMKMYRGLYGRESAEAIEMLGKLTGDRDILASLDDKIRALVKKGEKVRLTPGEVSILKEMAEKRGLDRLSGVKEIVDNVDELLDNIRAAKGLTNRNIEKTLTGMKSKFISTPAAKAAAMEGLEKGINRFIRTSFNPSMKRLSQMTDFISTKLNSGSKVIKTLYEGVTGIFRQGIKPGVAARAATRAGGKTAVSGIKGFLASIATIGGGTSGPIGIAVAVIADVACTFLIDSLFEKYYRYKRNRQAVLVVPLTYRGRPFTAGLKGHRGAVIGDNPSKFDQMFMGQGVWGTPLNMIMNVANFFSASDIDYGHKEQKEEWTKYVEGEWEKVYDDYEAGVENGG